MVNFGSFLVHSILFLLLNSVLKSAYGLLSKYDHIDHRSLAKFRDWGFSAGWKRVGSSLILWKFVRSVQDTAWLSFHGNPSKCRPSSLFQYEC